MKIIFSLLLFIIVVGECPGNELTLKEKELIKLSAYGLFYSKPAGSVAFLPKVGDSRYLDNVMTHYFLPESGFYTLPKKGNYFFRVNHHTDDEEVSYLAVIAYIIYPSNFNHRNPLALTRNIADWKSGEEGRKLDELRTGPKTPDVTLEDFFKAHSTNINTAAESDKILTFTWHAAVEPGSIFSWKYKSKWHNATPPLLDEFLKILKLSKQDHKAAITSHLLRFKTSRTAQKPLDFYFNADFARGAYLHIFSPLSPDFEKEFYFSFE